MSVAGNNLAIWQSGDLAISKSPDHQIARSPNLWIVLVGVVLCSAAQAQSIRGLDDDRFVKGLRERGMNDLAAHFLENYRTDDPLLKLEMLIESQKLRATDPLRPLPDRLKASLDVLATYRELFGQVRGQHWEMPVWKTDFAEWALTTVLRNEQYLAAGEFVEFGVPTIEQEKGVAQIAGEAATVMAEASDEMFFLVGDLPRRADFMAEFENTGRWRMLIEEYNDLSLPFYKALAWHYASLLPDPPPVVKLADAEALLAGLVERGKMSSLGKARAQGLLGRIRLRMGKLDEAAAALDAALATPQADPFDLLFARLAQTQVLVKKEQRDAALGILDELAAGELAAGNPLMRILITDARYRITAEKEEYSQLLASLTDERIKGWAQGHINRRIVERNPVALDAPVNIEGKTPLEVMAQVEALMEQAREGGAERGKLLGTAVAWIEALLKRGGLQPTDEAAARMKLGLAHYENKAYVGAVRAWRELAEKMPDRPESEPAAINAFKIAYNLIYKALPDNPEAMELVEGSLRTLLDKFPHAQVEPNQPASVHWYTLGGLNRRQGKYSEAISAYGNVAADHPYHADAVYESLFCRHQLWLAAEGEQRRDLAGSLMPAADRALDVLVQAKADDEPRRQKLKWMEGDTVLRRAEVAAESLGQGGAVRVALRDFDTKYGQFDDLVAGKRQLMVNVLLQLGLAQEAKAEVDRFRATNPDDAGPLIKGVLDTLHRQTEDVRKVNRNDPKIKELEQAGLEMARDLRDWAQKQPQIAGSPAKLLYFQNLYGRELIAIGQCDEAIALYTQLAGQDFGGGKTGEDQVDVLLGLGKAHWCNGDYASAEKPLNKVINKGTKDSPEWWDAWLTRLHVLDAKYEKLAATDAAQASLRREREIFLAVQQLERQYPALGGPQFRAELARLRNKSAPR